MRNSHNSYQRSSHFVCTARISRDGKEWHHARISDLSSHGLCLASTVDYEVDDTLWFDLIIGGFLSEFEVKTQGVVKHKDRIANENIYEIEFIGLHHDTKIRIDENVLGDRPVGRGFYTNG